MSHDPFAHVLTDVLLHQAPELVGVYDATLGRLTQVNAAGVRLLGYASEAALLAAPDLGQHLPALVGEAWAARCPLRPGPARGPANY